MFFSNYFSHPGVLYEHLCHKDIHSVTLTGHAFLLSNEWGFATPPTDCSQDTLHLEALSIKVAHKCKIVHIPRDVWKSYFCHAGEMNNPKKAASSEQDPVAFSVHELGPWSCCSWGCEFITPSHKQCQAEGGKFQREGKWRWPTGDGSSKVFMAEPLIGE